MDDGVVGWFALQENFNTNTYEISCIKSEAVRTAVRCYAGNLACPVFIKLSSICGVREIAPTSVHHASRDRKRNVGILWGFSPNNKGADPAWDRLSLVLGAEATGFEPAISCVTGRHVRPLHHASGC